MKKIWAIILAAGESSRMGSNKMLLPYQDNYLINHVINYVSDSQINNILLVLGAYQNEIIEAVYGQELNFCFNQDYKRGMLSSVQCGIRMLPGNTDAVMIFLGDQPSNNKEVINKMILEYHSSQKGIIIPVHNGKRGHPLLLDKKYFSTISNLDPDIGLRDLLNKYSEDIFLVDVDEPGILRDIDTMEDYQNELKNT